MNRVNTARNRNQALRRSVTKTMILESNLSSSSSQNALFKVLNSNEKPQKFDIEKTAIKNTISHPQYMDLDQ